jgi:NSS family neurotransmitter:Na+ symporter
MERESLKSRLGFILISAGCAIGIGNVWKFPYMAGQNGGAIFVLLYLVFLVIMCIPVMTMEFSLGRASRKSPVLLYQQHEPKGTKWHIHGKFAFVGNLLLMMFYTVVAGWMIIYFVKMAGGEFNGLTASQIQTQHGNMLADPWGQILTTFIVIIAGFLICSFGVQKSLEKVTKFMMIALLLIMIVLAVNGFFMEGAGEGLLLRDQSGWRRRVLR